MSNQEAYDQFSADYDRFVNWDERLKVELPFLLSELTELSPNSGPRLSILDAACGTGRHVIALSKAGLMCSGADISPGMIKTAQLNAKREKLEINFRQAGFGMLADVFNKQVFDGLLCLGNSLPHILSEAGLASALADFRSLLRPGGKLIIQNRNYDMVMAKRDRWMPLQTLREGKETWIFTRFYDFDSDGKITFNILLLSDQGGEQFHQSVISTRLQPLMVEQMRESLEQAGFGDICLFGDLQGSVFKREESGNLVMTAKAI